MADGMGTVVKKEVYTTTQPDGTIVTTTTKTKTQQDTEYEYTSASLNVDYCLTPGAWLRIIQIVIGFVVVGCVSGIYGAGPFLGVLGGQTFVLVYSCLCICLTFILLVIFFLGVHTTHLSELPWRSIDLVYSIIAVILYLVGGCLEAWYASGTWRNNCNRFILGRTVTCPVIGAWAAASFFCFVNCILYAIGAFLATRKKYYR